MFVNNSPGIGGGEVKGSEHPLLKCLPLLNVFKQVLQII